jgi:hypothetical protein
MIKLLISTFFLFFSCDGNNDKKINEYTYPEKKLNKEEVIVNTKDNDSAFIVFWEKFSHVIASSNKTLLKQLSLDSIYYRHVYISSDDFWKEHYNPLFDKELINKIIGKSDLEFLKENVEKKYYPEFIVEKINSDKVLVQSVNIRKNSQISKGNFIIIVLRFINTQKEYKFSGYGKYGS